MFCSVPERSGWNATNYGTVWNVTGDDGTGAHDCISPNRHAPQYAYVRPQPGSLSNPYRRESHIAI